MAPEIHDIGFISLAIHIIAHESTIRKVETFNNAYRMREKGAVLNWFDITEPEGYLSLNSKLADIMASPQRNTFFFGLIKNVCPTRTINYVRNNRILAGHVQTVQYIASITV